MDKYREQVLTFAKRMATDGLVYGSWGNISMKNDKGMIAITPSGLDYTTLAPDDICVLDSNGAPVDCKHRPSTELPLHLSVYQERADVGAIVHTHSTYACACAVCRVSIPPILEELAQVVGGPVKVAEYAPPGSKQLADNTIKALANRGAVLLANHGVIAVGESLKEAYRTAIIVEKAAMIYCQARSIGNPFTLSPEDIRVLHEYFTQHYSKAADNAAKQSN